MQAFLIREMLPGPAEMVAFDSDQIYSELAARNIVFGVIREAIEKRLKSEC